MKKNYFMAIILLMVGLAYAQTPFITTWQVSGDLSITVPVVGSSNDYTIDFGDGTVLNNQTQAVSHTYASAGTYTVSLSGDFNQIRFFDYSQANASKLKTVSQWGDTQWSSMNSAFYRCNNLTITASDLPDLGQVSDMSNMFFFCESLNQSIDSWDVSNVTTMERMFYYAKAFNQSLNSWDVSSVTNMDSMFYSAILFNQPLNNWDVSSVTTMYRMFYNVGSFNQPLNNWNVSNVTNMYRMFYKAGSFNQSLEDWDFESVTNFIGFLDDSNLNVENYDGLLQRFLALGLENKTLGAAGLEYCDAATRNYLINNSGWSIEGDSLNSGCPDTTEWFITTWQVTSGSLSITVPVVGTDNDYTIDFGDGTVLNNQTQAVSHAYASAGTYTVTLSDDFNQIKFEGNSDATKLLTIAQWGTTQWTSMQSAFYGCSNLTITDIDVPDLSQVTDMSYMFFGCSSLNQSLNSWDVSNVTTMERVFYNASSFNQPLDSWNVSNVTNMSYLFYSATSFNQSLNTWDVSSVTTMYRMFYNAGSFNQILDTWDVSNVVNMNRMFYKATIFDQPLDNWNFESVSNLVGFLDNSGLSVENYDGLLQRFLQLGLEDETLGAVGLGYCDEETRNSLINNLGWTINGDSLSPTCDLFITTWQVTNGALSITVPVVGTSNDYTIDFGDGAVLNNQTQAVSHTYASAGVYTVTLSGDFNQIKFQNTTADNAQKLLTIEQWGGTQWGSMQGAFYRCSNLAITATYVPDLSQVTDMSNMFFGCSSLNQSLNSWDVSNVTTMERMFYNADSFNQPLDNWDVSNVSNMDSMFYSAISFNQPLNSWDVSGVTTMYRMFYNAGVFNQPLNDWDVSSVVNMYRMFYKATVFNQPLDNWNFESVNNLIGFLDESNLSTENYDALLQRFLALGIENKTLGAAGLEYCDVIIRNSLISSLGWTITGDSLNTDCPAQPFITTWYVPQDSQFIIIPVVGSNNDYTIDFGDGTLLTNQTQSVAHNYASAGLYTVTMSGDFHQLQFQTGNVNSLKIQTIEQWGDIQWTSMQNAFAGCWDLEVFAADAPDLSMVTNMSNMFLECHSLNQYIGHWDVSNVTNMEGAFDSCFSFNKSIDNWDVSNVTNMRKMFEDTYEFNQPLNSWDVSSVTNMNRMFTAADAFNQPLNNWDVSGVTDMSSMFENAQDFNQPVGNWNISNVTTIFRMFYGCIAFDQPLDDWDVSSVSLLNGMFGYCRAFNQPLNSWDVSGVTGMSVMFTNCDAFNQPLNNWDVSGVTDMYGMFSYALSFNQPLDNWDVSGVTTMYSMFIGADSFNQSLNSWDVSGVDSMYQMFKNASSFNQPLNNWDVSNATFMSSMFSGAISFNQPLHNWDVSNITDMTDMFSEATSFNQTLDSWNFNGTVSLNNFLNNSGLDVENYDALLEHFLQLNLQNRTLGAEGLEYCAEAIRNSLINNSGWTITGDSLNGDCPADTSTAFITAWQVSAGDLSIIVPVVGTDNDYTVDFGDGTVLTNQTQAISHTYADGGIYVVTLSGDFDQIKFDGNAANAEKLLNILQWGTTQWMSMQGGFKDCANLTFIPSDAPDLSQATDMSYMFSGCSSFNQSLDNWNFNSNADFVGFVDNSGLDVENYDVLLQRFLTLELQNKTLGAAGLEYCDEATRDSLINNWGWTINGDSFNADCSAASQLFITTWNVTTGAGPLSITIPVYGTNNNYTVDFGDGTVLTNQIQAVSHTYSSVGVYTVKLSGDFSRISFQVNSANYNKLKLLSVEQWGTTQWASMQGAFNGCNNMVVNAVDVPDLSNVTDMSYMFYGCGSLILNSSLNDWDVSNVTNMSYLFTGASYFNQPLNSWDMSNVTNIIRMFDGCTSFNQPLNDWDISNVLYVNYLFYHCDSFNQPLNNWNVSGITNMSNMFTGAASFNQSLNDWDVSGVTNISGMFSGCDSFDQPLNNWDVSGIKNMSSTFSGCDSFNQPLNNWDVSIATNMGSMFSGATSFNQPLNDWDVSSVLTMSYMFSGATSFNQPLDSWDTSNVSSITYMFNGAISFNQPLNNWDVSNISFMTRVFYGATSFNQPLNNWDVSNVSNMYQTFGDAVAFNQPLDSWDFNSNVNLLYFLDNGGLDVENYDALLQRFLQLGLQNRTLGAVGLEYCDETTRNSLIDSNGWTINGDSLSNECMSARPLLVEQDISETTGTQILLYPNPADDFVKISVIGDIELEAITVYNLQGRKLLFFKQNLENINIEALSAGVYLLHMDTNRGLKEYRLVKN